MVMKLFALLRRAKEDLLVGCSVLRMMKEKRKYLMAYNRKIRVCMKPMSERASMSGCMASTNNSRSMNCELLEEYVCLFSI